MESKRTFAHTAARLSLGLMFVACALYFAPYLARALQISMPLLNATALFTLFSGVLVFCLVASLVCGFVALSGVRQHGREGILIPASIGLTLSALMLAPILYGSGYAASSSALNVFAREKKPGKMAPGPSAGTQLATPKQASKKSSSSELNNFIPAEKRTDLIHDPVRNVLYISAGTEVLRYSFTSNQFLAPFELGGNLRGLDLSPDGETLAVADRSRAAEQVWVHLVGLTTGTNSRIVFSSTHGEGGTYSVAFGADGMLYTSSAYDGSGWVPFRQYDLATRKTRELQRISQDTMLSVTPDRRLIAFAEANNSAGRFGVYDTEKKKTVLDSKTERFNWEVAISRDGTSVAVPNFRATTITGDSPQSIGGSDGWPIAAAFHPARDIVFFPWAGSAQIRAYNTRTWKIVEQIDFNDRFEHTGNYAFVNGRIRVSQDGAWLFVTVKGGVCYVRPKLNNEFAAVDRR